MQHAFYYEMIHRPFVCWQSQLSTDVWFDFGPCICYPLTFIHDVVACIESRLKQNMSCWPVNFVQIVSWDKKLHSCLCIFTRGKIWPVCLSIRPSLSVRPSVCLSVCRCPWLPRLLHGPDCFKVSILCIYLLYI